MSRMETKKLQKKKKRYVKLGLALIFCLLVSGILATDYALRDMMALFDGSQLFTYRREVNLHHIEIFGEEFSLDQEMIAGNLRGYIHWGRIKSSVMIEFIKGWIKRMSG